MAPITSERDRELPLSVLPHDEEPLFSWVDRLAWRYRASRSALLDRLRLREGKRVYVGAGVALDEHTASHIARVSRLNGPEAVHAMTLRSFDGVCLRWSGATDSIADLLVFARREWAWTGGTLVCPDCLAERDGAHRLSWQLPWHVACPEHGCLLIDSCPACGDELPETAASLARQRSWSMPAGHCRARAADAGAGEHARPCGHDLRVAATTALDADGELLRAQRQLLEALGVRPGRDELRVAGVTVSRHEYFDHLRGLCGVLLRGADPQLLGLGDGPIRDAYAEHCAQRDAQLADSRSGRYRITLPRRAAVLAALLPHAVRCLRAESVDEMAGMLVGHTLRGSSNGRFYEVQHAATPPVAQALALARHGRLPVWLAASRGFARPADGGSPLQARHIPRLLWPEAWKALLEDLLPTRRPQSARQALSLMLARTITPHATWREVATGLGVGADQARKVTIGLSKRTGDPELERRLADALGLLRGVLEQQAHADPRALIDYRQREQAFAGLGLIDEGAWADMCAQAGVGEGYGSRRLHASAWAWGELTGRDPREAPVLQDSVPLGRTVITRGAAQFESGHARYLREAHPALAGQLRAWCKRQIEPDSRLRPWGELPLAELLCADGSGAAPALRAAS